MRRSRILTACIPLPSRFAVIPVGDSRSSTWCQPVQPVQPVPEQTSSRRRLKTAADAADTHAMNVALRLARRAACALGGVAVACSCLAGPSAASAPSPPNAGLAAAAVQALLVERDLVSEGGALPQPIPRALHEEIKTADDAGVAVLAQLRDHGFVPSGVIATTLGPIPAPEGFGPPRPPTRDQYDAAIRELGGDPGPAVFGPPPQQTRAEAGDATAVTALVVSVIALVGIVGIMVGMLVRRRKDRWLIEDAMTDSLTGLCNRRRLDNDLLLCTSKKKMSVGVLMVDVDNFKSYNDARGHSAGDRVLQRVGAALTEHVRSQDVVYRYGGEEFCVLLPDVGEHDAMIVAERIRVATASLELHDSTSVTVSVGVALGTGAEVMTTLERADGALYDAKHNGRDCVALANVGSGVAYRPRRENSAQIVLPSGVGSIPQVSAN